MSLLEGLLAGGVSAAGNLLGGAINTAGQVYANRMNRSGMNRNNALAVQMANTAHRREIKDLKAAGLNPILSVNGSGAQVPQLGFAEQANPLSGLGEGIAGVGDGVSSAVRYATLEKPKVESQIKVNTTTAENLKAQNDNLKKQNQEIESRIDKNRAETFQKFMDSMYPGVLGQGARSLFNSGKGRTPFDVWLEKVYPGFRSNSAKSVKEDDAKVKESKRKLESRLTENFKFSPNGWSRLPRSMRGKDFIMHPYK